MPLLSLDQIDLYWQERGDGTPFLLLHGLGSSGRDWERQVAHFSDRYRVVTFDARGHGRWVVVMGLVLLYLVRRVVAGGSRP